MAINSAPTLTAAKDICLIRILLEIVTNDRLLDRLKRLFNVHRSQGKSRSNENYDK
ncbi:hypothetical protein [Parasphingorhabdus sp.]|uniref:hypothetical protein n=1 Tax=Parasphingorhabdus sp. TaxID=2709688 RepID=UPI0030013DC0